MQNEKLPTSWEEGGDVSPSDVSGHAVMPISKQEKAASPFVAFSHDLAKNKEKLRVMLPENIEPEKFMRIVLMAVQKNPFLLSLNRDSLFTSCLSAAQDGLLLDGKEAALVPFKGTVTYIPMVSGILKKVRNSGELATIMAEIVYDKDKFRYWTDSDGQHIEHEPNVFGERGKISGVYAIARTKHGDVYIEVMTETQVQAVKSCSKAKDGPWQGPFADEMRRKTAIRRLAKRLPMDTVSERVIQRSDDLYDFEDQPPSQRGLAAEINATNASGNGPDSVQSLQDLRNEA